MSTTAFRRLALVAATLACGLAPSVAHAADDLTVLTDRGLVRGVVDGALREWRGIPYAAPPVGELRGRPPAPAERWRGVRAAGEFAPECIQPAPEGTAGSEDCLYLNVFAPRRTPRGSPLAVMVHLHPGSNTFGDALTAADG